MNQNGTFLRKADNQNILFVSDLPSTTTEDDLSKFFKNYNITLVKVNQGKFNTYAYIYFDNVDHANKARRELNGEIFLPKQSTENTTGKPLRICKYEPKNQIIECLKDSSKSLLVKNLDSSITAKELYQLFEEFGEVKSSKLEVDERGFTKNYGYIHYNDASSAEFAKQKLNGKEIKGKKLEIVNLIPSRTKENIRNNLYVKNIPIDFSEDDLKKLFSKYGEILSCIISKDDKGNSRGFGFVCFTSPLNAVQAQKELNEKTVTFPGLPPLYVSFAMKKEDRVAMLSKNLKVSGDFKFLANLNIWNPNLSPNQIDVEKELRLFIKVIFLQEYNPNKIELNLNKGSAVVTLKSARDLEEFFKKYNEYCNYNIPTFFVFPFGELKNPPTMNNEQFQITPLNNQFANMAIMNPTQIPLNNKFNNRPQHESKSNGKQFANTKRYSKSNNTNDDSNSVEDTAALIYEFVEKKYADDAGKITGMIVDLGLKEMKNLLSHQDKLSKVVDEAYYMLKGQS